MLPAQPWQGVERTAWHEAGHAVIAWHHQVRYEPLLLDAAVHLGGYEEGSLGSSPTVTPPSIAAGSTAWSEDEIFTHQVWLSAGAAAEELFVSRLSSSDVPSTGRERDARCGAPHLECAAATIRSHQEHASDLVRHLLDRGGASRRRLRALLGPREAVVGRGHPGQGRSWRAAGPSGW